MTKSGLGWPIEQPWLSGLAIAAIVVAAPANAATLNNWQFDTSNQQLVITLPKNVTPRYYLVAEPARIVLDLPDTEVGAIPTQQSYGGAVRQIRIAQFQPGLTRIVLELSPQAVLAPGQVELQRLEGSDGQTQRWGIRPLLVTDTPTDSVTPDMAQTASATPTPPETTPSPVETAASPSTAITPVAPTTTPADMPTANAEPTLTDEPNPAPIVSAEQSDQPVTPSAALPPLEPGAIEIPIAPPETAETPETIASSPAAETPQAIAQPEPAEPTTEQTVEQATETNPPTTTAEVQPEPAAQPEAAEPTTAAGQPVVTAEAETPLPQPAPVEPDQSVDAAAPQPEIPADSPAIAPPPPATPMIPPVAAAPTAIPSAPLPVDFSKPPSSEPLELATPEANAASLSVPSVSQNRLTPAQPIPDTFSFPTAGAGNVTVPPIATVQPNPSAITANSEEDNAEAPAEAAQTTRPTGSSNQTGANSFPTPSAMPTQPTAPAAVSFGQPLAATSPPASPVPAVAAQSTQPAIPFGQPMSAAQPTTAPTVQPAAQSSQAVNQPYTPVQSSVPVIQFGEPLPFSQS